MTNRPFQNFKGAITSLDYFRGRTHLLTSVLNSPMDVRILIGGRRLGKTSTLHAIEWTLLHPTAGNLNRAFPVYVNLSKEQPGSIENFFYTLVRRLREAFIRWERAPGDDIRQRYQMFLSQIAGAEAALGPFLKLKVTNPDNERRLPGSDFEYALRRLIDEIRSREYNGICFLWDGGDYFVEKSWANDALSYFRALIDSGNSLSPFLGLILSGFRGVKEYKQRIGSALFNIGTIAHLGPLTSDESNELIEARCQMEGRALSPGDVAFVMREAGGHPYLIQQVVNALLDRAPNTSLTTVHQIMLKNHSNDFSAWWNLRNTPDGFGPNERAAYHVLVQKGSSSIISLAKNMRVAEFEALDALECLAATGIITESDEGAFELGCKLFADWVLNTGANKAISG